jgi:ribosomal protein L11 methyltransferase
MPWHALTLEVDAATAEAMSEALLEAGAQSVALDRVDGPRPSLTALLALDLDPRNVLGHAARLAGLAAAPAFSVEELADEDWVRKTQAQFPPIEVGARLWVGPSWHEPPVGRAIVRLDPGMAFGTGTHPTTRLMLGFLVQHVAGGESVLDYGCGSGILAIAAAKLGAARVDAVDLDPVAVETTAANARDNGVAIRAAVPDALPAAAYAMVVSNILAQPLILLAPLLAARCAPGGRLALAGILQTQAAEVIDAYKPWLSLRVESLHDGWVLLAGIRQR